MWYQGKMYQYLYVLHSGTITLLVKFQMPFWTNNHLVLKVGGRGYWAKLLQPWVTMEQIFAEKWLFSQSVIYFAVLTCLRSFKWAVLVYWHLWIHSRYIAAWLERLIVHQQRRHLLLSGEVYLACQQQLDFIGHFCKPPQVSVAKQNPAQWAVHS